MNCYGKVYIRWLRLLTMLFPVQIYIARSVWHFGDFCNIFPPSTGEDQKKSYHLRIGLGTVPYNKSSSGYCITFINSLDEGLW